METRERLVEGMRELLWERGYVGTSPRAILAKADAGQGSMYHYFSGKAELAEVALRRSAETMRAEGEMQLSGPGTSLERITAYLLREREVLRGCRIGRMTEDPDVIADDTLRAPLDETFAWFRSTLVTLLEDGQSSGELLPTFSPVQVAATLVAVLQGGYVLARAAQSVQPFDDAIAGIIQLVSLQRALQPTAA